MSISLKKVVAISLSLATAVTFAGGIMSASAQTVSIESLLAQIAQLQALIAQLQTGSQTTTTVTSTTFTRDLTVGSTGADVKSLQDFLVSKGDLVIAQTTTYFGSMTKAALAKYQAKVGIAPAAGYFGPKTRAYVSSLAVGTGTTTGTTGTTTGTTTTGEGLTISLASDNPAGAVIPKGASGVAFTKVTVSGKGTLDSLTFTRKGIGAAGDFASSGVYLYEGAARLTSGKTINSTTHEVSFVSLGLKIDGSRTFTLAASIASSATASNMHSFELTSAGGTPTPTGFPKSGNSFSIGGQSVGGVEIAGGATPVNPKVGQAGVKVLEFTLTASSTEDIEINRVAFTEGGTLTNDYLTNAVLKQGGVTLSTAAKIGAKDLLTFEFASPFKIEKGQVRTFEVYADISGLSRADDTIGLYVDSTADVSGKGLLYGYPINPNIASSLDATADRQITVQGGDVTIAFNGPISGDISLRGQDVTVYDFTITSQNNIEIKNLRFHATTTGLISGEGFMDMKIWDISSNAVITSAVDISTSTDQTFTDVINLSAGQSKRFKVTVDVDADNEDGDDITVSLLAFVLGDIKNLDNNTNVALASIVPNSTISGNVLDTRVPTLDVQLASTPSSQTYVKGTSLVPLVGLSFRATGGDVRLDMVKITASSTSGTLTSGEITSLALYDETGAKISDLKSLDTTALTASFTGLNKTIPMGTTKVFTVKGNIDSNAATEDEIYYVYVAAVSTTNLTVYDKDGNSATLSGTAANSANSVTVTVVGNGNVSVAKAADDVESEAGIALAGREEVLGKFKFTSTNEEMTINKLQILVVGTNSATATSATAADEVPTIKLYSGSTQIGNAAGYTVTASGDYSGVAFIDNLGWKIPKNDNSGKILTVKGVLNTTDGGADTGADVYVSVMNQANSSTTFEAQGATAKDTVITAATGNRKVVYKTKPVISLPTQGIYAIKTTADKVYRFKVSADSAGSISWKKAQFQVSMTDATLAAASTTNVKIYDVTGGGSTQLTLATVYSGVGVASSTTVVIPGGSAGYVGVELNDANEQEIAAGSYEEYELHLTFSDISAATGADPRATISFYRQETTPANATWYAGIAGAATDTDMNPSFIWSDRSNVSHATSTGDWANGVYVKSFDNTTVVTRD